MDLKEIGQLSFNAEIRHWWIRTRFYFLEKQIRAFLLLGAKAPLRILEVGCGTAQNLFFLKNESATADQIGTVVGYDPNIQADEFWAQHARRLSSDGKATITASWEEVQAKGPYDIVISTDVLEHLEDQNYWLITWRAVLRPGGILLLMVPSFPSLWSRHDERLGHLRRYRREALEVLVSECGYRPLGSTYIFSALFIPVWLIRVASARLGLRSTVKEGNSDLLPSSPPVNWILERLGRLDAALNGCSLFGTSAYLWAVRKEMES